MASLQGALALTQKLWKIIPLHGIVNGRCTCGNASCPSPGKHPRTKNGLKNASSDEGIVRRWWQQWPDSNVGLRTGAVSGVVVVDIDNPAALDAMNALPTTYRVNTGRGFHLYYKHPGWEVRPRAGLVPGCDIRGDDSYVVAEGSAHVRGNAYQAVDPTTPLVELPEWLQKVLNGSEKHAGYERKT